MMRKRMETKGKWFLRIWTGIFFLGIAIMLYPKIGNLWNSGRQSRVVEGYEQKAEEMDSHEKEEMIEKSEKYNWMLLEQNNPIPNDKNEELYGGVLNLDENGMIGYLEIPAIHVRMPIYHGTGNFAISNGAGHVEGSSFPVGGKGTHCVLSSHRGLPGAKLFSDLDKLKPSDIFKITVLEKTIVYKVDKITITEPGDTEMLRLEKEKDYCTLLTCTPYGVNTKRLLVRGTRCGLNEKAEAIRTGDNRNGMRYYVILLSVILAAVIWRIRGEMGENDADSTCRKDGK